MQSESTPKRQDGRYKLNPELIGRMHVENDLGPLPVWSYWLFCVVHQCFKWMAFPHQMNLEYHLVNVRKVYQSERLALFRYCLRCGLTYSFLAIYLMSVVWTFHTFKHNFGMKQNFTDYLKGSCRESSDLQFSFKYFLNIAFVREISPKLSDGFGRCRHE